MLPRLFLRELVDVLDKVDQHEAYAPTVRAVSEDALTDEERQHLAPPPTKKKRRKALEE